MAETKQATVLAVRSVRSADPRRIGKQDKLVTYVLEGGPPRSVILPAESFNEAAVAQAIANDLAEHGPWQNRVLNLPPSPSKASPPK